MPKSLDSFNCRRTLNVGRAEYVYYNLIEAEKNGLTGIAQLPYSMKVLLENLLRNEDGRTVTKESIQAVAGWLTDKGTAGVEIAYRPARVLMQDFTGVPAVVDLAAMRDAMASLGGDPQKINPLVPVDLVIDHSVIVDEFGTPMAFARNVELEYERNQERYKFLKWGQQAFRNFRVVPPGTGICHQVNLEYLGQVVWTLIGEDGDIIAYPDTCVGTDSHTTMINGLGVLGWGVGGIEAEAAMLGQPVSMLLARSHRLPADRQAQGRRHRHRPRAHRHPDAAQEGRRRQVRRVLRLRPLQHDARRPRHHRQHGAGIRRDLRLLPGRRRNHPLPDDVGPRRNPHRAGRGLFQGARHVARHRLGRSGVHRPARTRLSAGRAVDGRAEASRRPRRAGRHSGRLRQGDGNRVQEDRRRRRPLRGRGRGHDLGHGDVVIAAITSCTNTSNPSVLMAAGLLARNANRLGLKQKPWVKTSLAPGSQVVAEYLDKSGLQKELDQIGFNLVGFGCTTCIGNSGPLPAPISKTINDKGLIAAAVLSGNRNFEGRVSPDVQANYLASPPLVVAYALAGTVTMDLTTEPLGEDRDGKPVFLKDIWPSTQEIDEFITQNVTRELFARKYADVFNGDDNWKAVQAPEGQTYTWDDNSTYVQNPPYFVGMGQKPAGIGKIKGARVLGLFGDKITTDHISPAGSIKAASPAGKYLTDHGVGVADFNQYGTRRGNHEVMMRGTFANIRIRNHMLGENGREGGYTIHYPSKEEMPIYDAAMEYRQEGVPLVIFAGVEYGNGSSRDWAAKGTNLLGVRAVIAQSFERIHRSNLVGMGVIPFVFEEGTSWASLGLKGDETVTIDGLETIRPRQKMLARITYGDGTVKNVPILCRIDTVDELEYFKNGGILQYVLRDLAA